MSKFASISRLLGFALLLVATVASARQTVANGVRNVRICDVYGRSVVVRWNAPDSVANVAGYYLTWRAAGEKSHGTKLIYPDDSGLNAAQLQPLDPVKRYTVTIATMDQNGGIGDAVTLDDISPKGTYEQSLRDMTGYGNEGFLYLPENDPADGRVDITKINSDFYHLNVGTTGAAYCGGVAGYDHSCVAVNTQQHWHMIASDSGSGSITSRVKGSIYLGDGGTRHLRWDCDSGPFARQTWYIVLTPAKVETFVLLPNNGDAEKTGQLPLEQIRIKFSGARAEVTRYSGGNAVAKTTFDWRDKQYYNVRQLMGMNISKRGLTFLADTAYDGTLRDRGAFATDLSGWKSCYCYFTLGSYNNKKQNDVHGVNALGQETREFAGGIMHWGNVAFDAPAGFAPPVELSYFNQPDLVARTDDKPLNVSQPLTVAIPDPIPATAVSRELDFTDVSGCIPCLSGTHKLVLSVNGRALADLPERALRGQAPTYRWPIPAGVLRQGENVVQFEQRGSPEPIGLRNVHIDIDVPRGQPYRYTPPPAHPILDVMPDHNLMEAWALPEVQIVAPTAPVSRTVTIPYSVNAAGTAHLSGSFVGFDRLWAEVDGKPVWSRDTNGAGVGSLRCDGRFTLDTSSLSDGYHRLLFKAHEKSGSIGYSNGSNLYGYDDKISLVVHNGPPGHVKPIIEAVRQTHVEAKSAENVPPDASIRVQRVQTYTVRFDVISPTFLRTVALCRRGDNGQFTAMTPFDPGRAPRRSESNGATRYTFQSTATLWGWWPFDAEGKDVWRILATDVDGATASYPFSWQLVAAPRPPATQAKTAEAAPSISSFRADPPVVNAGWATTLAWSVVGARSVTIDNGVGKVSATGRICVTPDETTTYVLRARTRSGVVERRVTVTTIPQTASAPH